MFRSPRRSSDESLSIVEVRTLQRTMRCTLTPIHSPPTMRINLNAGAIALTLSLLALTNGCKDSSNATGRSRDGSPRQLATARRVVNVALDSSRYLELQGDPATAWQIEGMVLTRNRLFVHDAVRDSILVFELDSGFQRAKDAERLVNAVSTDRKLLLPATDTTIVLLDRRASIAHVLSDSAHEIATWRWQTNGEPSAFCIAADTTAFVFVHAGEHYQLLQITQDGRVSRQSVAPEPWLGYYKLHWLLGHVVAGGATRSGECVFGHFFNLGLSFVSASGVSITAPYAESLAAATVRIDTSRVNGVFRKSESIQNAERGARSIALSGDSVLMLFEGKEKGAGTRLDVYDGKTKSYRHTVDLGERVDAVAASTKSVALLVRRHGRVGVVITSLRSAPVGN